MTADFIAFHASARPDAIAMIDHGRAIAYREFDGALAAITRAVSRFGPTPGSSVAVGCADKRLHLLLLLAFERLGVAALSYNRARDPEGSGLLASLDFVVPESGSFNEGSPPHRAITGEWLEAAMAAGDAGETPLPPKRPTDPVRLLRTSSTTGDPKQFAISRRMHAALIEEWIWGFALTARSRFLLASSFTVRGTFVFASACLRAGGTLVVDDRSSLSEALSRYAIDRVILMPIELGRVLDTLPADFAKPADLSILCFGAPTSPALRERAIARLASDVCDLYGSIEAGTVSTTWQRTPGGFGILWPKVRVEVLDDRGEPLPHGKPGRIRLKTEHMIEGYLGDPEATARMFQDGWFYPGDLGILHGPRQLQILGRADDLINIGGYKYAPAALEELVLAHAAVGDAGVGSLENADGIEQLYIGISDPRAGDREILERITQAFRGLAIGVFFLVKLPEIPRNANGKIQRDRLRDLLRSAGGDRPR